MVKVSGKDSGGQKIGIKVYSGEFIKTGGNNHKPRKNTRIGRN